MNNISPPHFLGIGRLGGQDEQGWHHLMIKPAFLAEMDQVKDLYLIFEKDRVFYVTISDRKTCDKKLWVKFLEDGIAAERKRHREVYLAIDAEDLPSEGTSERYLGLDVAYEDTLIGCVAEVFYNGAHDVLVVATALDEDILIPAVKHYLLPESDPYQALRLQNMDDLLDVSGFCIRAGCLERTID